MELLRNKMKKKTSVVHQVFIEGRDSSRPQHLQFNDFCYKILWYPCLGAAVSVGVATIYYDANIGLPWQLILVPPLFKLHEMWATCDNDYAWKLRSGFRKLYWHIYSMMMPRHRSIFSHSLLFGTPIRFCIAYWIPILLFVIGWNHDFLITLRTSDVSWLTAAQLLTFPKWAIALLAYWYAACNLADIAHMTLDKYNPVQWFIGKK